MRNLFREAVEILYGSDKWKACEDLQINERSYRRWMAMTSGKGIEVPPAGVMYDLRGKLVQTRSAAGRVIERIDESL